MSKKKPKNKNKKRRPKNTKILKTAKKLSNHWTIKLGSFVFAGTILLINLLSDGSSIFQFVNDSSKNEYEKINLQPQRADKVVSELSTFIDLFDKGDSEISTQIALSLKTLLYSFENQQSLLSPEKSNIWFINSQSTDSVGNWLPYTGLLSQQWSSGKPPKFVPRIRHFTQRPFKKQKFKDWWNQKIFDDRCGNTFSRKQLILNVAYYDGNENFSRFTPSDFDNLSRNNGYKWFYNDKTLSSLAVPVGGGCPKKNKTRDNMQETPSSVTKVAVRAIAEEVLYSYLDYTTN